MLGRIGYRGTVVLAAALALAACGKKDNAGTDTGMAMSGTDTGAMAAGTANAGTAAGSTSGTAAAPQLNDANIVALLDEANAADSAAGTMAATKGTSASVKEFGKDMARDHHNLRTQGQDLAKKLNVTPQPPANDTLPKHASMMADSLGKQAKGAAWDKAYIDHEVAMHQAVLDLATAAQNQAQNAELKALITKAAPIIQGHLKNAQAIQAKLGGGATTASAGASGATTTKTTTKTTH